MDAQLLAATIFAEADKSSIDNFIKDGTAAGHVLNNRASRPNRFKNLMEGFSSYGGDEFKKFMTKNLTENEQEYYKKSLQIANGILRGEIPDPTGGADHMYNPFIDDPNDWNVRWGSEDAEPEHMYYPMTYETSRHVYRKETLRTKGMKPTKGKIGKLEAKRREEQEVLKGMKPRNIKPKAKRRK